jgi:hypothetical protein
MCTRDCHLDNMHGPPFIDKKNQKTLTHPPEPCCFGRMYVHWREREHEEVGELVVVNSNLVQYLLQTDIQKRTEKIQWQIQTLHRDFSPGNPNRENQHILY